jgi:DNA-binding PadR family transcriptional regulator
MDNQTFSEIKFTELHSQQIKNEIQKQTDREEDILTAVMQLLVQEKTGYELAKCLRRRGIRKFDDQEGYLYILLHRMEQQNILQASWLNKDEAKFYRLTNKGRKLLQKSERKAVDKQILLKGLLEG